MNSIIQGSVKIIDLIGNSFRSSSFRPSNEAYLGKAFVGRILGGWMYRVDYYVILKVNKVLENIINAMFKLMEFRANL